MESFHFEIATWVPSSIHAPLPEGAVLAGHDIDGSQIFVGNKQRFQKIINLFIQNFQQCNLIYNFIHVGRAFHAGDQLPAKVIPSKRSAYVAYGGQEVFVDNYDVLCHGSVVWVTGKETQIILSKENWIEGNTLFVNSTSK